MDVYYINILYAFSLDISWLVGNNINVSHQNQMTAEIHFYFKKQYRVTLNSQKSPEKCSNIFLR